jgi:hypothetical protein
MWPQRLQGWIASCAGGSLRLTAPHLKLDDTRAREVATRFADQMHQQLFADAVDRRFPFPADCRRVNLREAGVDVKVEWFPVASDVWFADKSEAYLDMHLIPKDAALWKLERFEAFIVERKKLMREKFASWVVMADRGRAAAG